MKNQVKSLIVLWTLCLTFMAGQALATLSVEFAATPLFSEAKIVPGDEVTRTVKVKNTGDTPETVEVLVENYFFSTLANSLSIEIESGGTIYFHDTLSNFFINSPINLGVLGSTEERVYNFSVDFPAVSGNDLMLTQTGFDLVIGFLGGEQISDNPTGGGTGGGGGGGGTKVLHLFNEEVAQVYLDSSTAIVTWDSNLDSTSYLICGEISSQNYQLSVTAPLFGYEFFLPELVAKKSSHAMAVSGVVGGTYECRPAGRLSPFDDFTVGQPVRFAFPTPLVAGVSTTTGASLLDSKSLPEGKVLGDQVSLWPLGGLSLGLGGLQNKPFGFLLILFVIGYIFWYKRRITKS